MARKPLNSTRQGACWFWVKTSGTALILKDPLLRSLLNTENLSQWKITKASKKNKALIKFQKNKENKLKQLCATRAQNTQLWIFLEEGRKLTLPKTTNFVQERHFLLLVVQQRRQKMKFDIAASFQMRKQCKEELVPIITTWLTGKARLLGRRCSNLLVISQSTPNRPTKNYLIPSLLK